MMNPNLYIFDSKADILKEPILKRKSGEIIDTEISLVTKADLKLYNLLLRMCTKIQRDAKPRIFDLVQNECF